MKRNFASKASLALLLLCNALFFTSCSSLLLRRGQSVDSVQQNGLSTPTATVPKEQYDELSRKYQELLKTKTESIHTPVAPEAVAPVDPNAQTKPTIGSATAIDPSELVNRIDKAIPDTATIDSVDALTPDTKSQTSKGPPVPTSMGVQHVNNTDDVDDQISRLREAQESIKVNKFDNALTILKELENSKEKQIVVRAKMMLGELLFNQGEFDLASQVYDEVIKKYAFSGFVLKALGKLVACSEKLKQPEKQAKYYSLLHDFFEAN